MERHEQIKRTHSERSMAFRAGYELTRPHLFKRLSVLATGCITQLVSLAFIPWIVIYPMDNALQVLNNWGFYLIR